MSDDFDFNALSLSLGEKRRLEAEELQRSHNAASEHLRKLAGAINSFAISKDVGVGVTIEKDAIKVTNGKRTISIYYSSDGKYRLEYGAYDLSDFNSLSKNDFSAVNKEQMMTELHDFMLNIK